MVNLRELLINVVTRDKPKVLREQARTKKCVAGAGYPGYPAVDTQATGEKGEPNPPRQVSGTR